MKSDRLYFLKIENEYWIFEKYHKTFLITKLAQHKLWPSHDQRNICSKSNFKHIKQFLMKTKQIK